MTWHKLPNVTQRIQFIEASIAKLQGELEDAEGERRVALELWVAEVRRALERIARIELH